MGFCSFLHFEGEGREFLEPGWIGLLEFYSFCVIVGRVAERIFKDQNRWDMCTYKFWLDSLPLARTRGEGVFCSPNIGRLRRTRVGTIAEHIFNGVVHIWDFVLYVLN